MEINQAAEAENDIHVYTQWLYEELNNMTYTDAKILMYLIDNEIFHFMKLEYNADYKLPVR